MNDAARRIAALDPARLAVLSDRLAQRGSAEPAPAQRRTRVSRLSSAQARLWVLQQLAPESPAYHIAIAAHLQGRLDVAALARALGEVMRRHHVLRTVFPSERGEPRAMVLTRWSAPIGFVNLERVADATVRLGAILQANARRPFAIDRTPLLRAHVFRLSPGHHVLSLLLHHIVADGWSLGLLANELGALYAAFRRGRGSPLAEPAMQYADFAESQHQWLNSPSVGPQLEYWTRTLGDDPPVRALSADHAAPAVPSDAGDREPFALPKALSDGLRRFAEDRRVTLYAVLHAGLAALLYRHTGQRTILIGTGVANRQRVEHEAVVGSFVNTLVLRAEVTGQLTFADLVRQLHAGNLRALTNQDVPYDAVIAALRPERTQLPASLFDVELVLQNIPRPSLELPELEVTFEHVDTGTVKSPLTIDVSESGGLLGGMFEYSTALFDRVTIRRLMARWQSLLTGAMANADLRIRDVPLLTPDDREAIRVEPPIAPPSRFHSVADLVAATAAARPDAEAVVFAEQRLTYRELERRANRLAGHLRLLGAAPEQPIGLHLDRSIDLLVATLAILKSGAAYVPLDPDLPPERLRFMIRDAQVRLVIGRVHEVGNVVLREEGVQVVDPDATVNDVQAPPPARCHPDNLAYIIYTSGSTGVPKGVQIPHRALVNFAVAAAQRFDIQPADRVLQFASVSFDVFAEEVFPAWVSGACVVVEQRARIASSLDLADVIQAAHVTVVELPTAFWHDWVYRLESGARPLPPCLRLVLIGGELTAPESVRSWRRFGVPLINVYGLTETAVTNATHAIAPLEVEAESPILGERLPIGHALPGSAIYVLDRDGGLAPPGTVGDIHITGPCLARGYVGHPDWTADRFRPSPFEGEPGARLYRTGDRGRHRSDGALEYIGRLDDQVNLRGVRIDLNEIAAALRRHPGIHDAVVIVSSDRSLSLPADAAPGLDRSVLKRRTDDVEIALTLRNPGFVRPPRASQRAWLFRRALDEFADDLAHLDRVARRFVPGSSRPPLDGDWPSSEANYERSQLTIQGQQVMQDWERPLMQAMAAIAAETHGDVLEIGFGLGISATCLQEIGVRSHTIVEPNAAVLRRLAEWAANYPGRAIRAIPGRWQDVTAQLGLYDAVFFDTIPVTEEEYVESVAADVVMAEALFPTASACLKPGGVFTWYTNEIDTFSRRHQRLAFRYFSSLALTVVKLQPPADCQYWWADSMVAVKAVK